MHVIVLAMWCLFCSVSAYTDTVCLQEEVFKRREEGLKKKDLELQESLIRFSKFLQENDAKRMHALKKAQDERKTREEKEREVEQLVSPCHGLMCTIHT